MTRKSHNLLTKALLSAAVLLSLLTTSCERKDLWLPSQQGVIDLAIYDIDLELYFGFNWRYEWIYDWPEDDPDYGPLGYTEPYGVRATIYNLDGRQGRRLAPFTRNMVMDGQNRVSLTAATWYDMLFYNTGTSAIIPQADDAYTYYNMTTRANSLPSHFPSTRDGQDEHVDTLKAYDSYNQPDELFGVFIEDLYVSEDPEDYEETVDAEGNTIYLYRINATLEPYSFIYLIQPVIINNYCDINDPEKPDSTARVRGVNGLTVTGLAQGVELYSRQDWTNAISITSEDVKPMQTHKTYRAADGSIWDADVCASRILTWGLPGIDPLQARRTLDETGVAPENEEGNWIGLSFVLRGGDVKSRAFDISEQIAKHPTGGVITIVIDAEKEFTRDETDHKTNPNTGGGFNASVDNWQNEVNSEITI